MSANPQSIMRKAAGFICLVACALAQDTTTSTNMGSSQTSTSAILPSPTSSSPSITAVIQSTSQASQTSQLPTVSLFLPSNDQEYIEASVISVAPDQTAYALGCARNVSTSRCSYDPSITITAGISSFVMTDTYALNKTTIAAQPLTVQCQLVGAAFNQTPHVGATSAVCTNSSAISGLGKMGSTSTLASSEIKYYPVTITAGYEKVLAAATMTGNPAKTSSAAASGRTAWNLGLGGALGLAVLGLV